MKKFEYNTLLVKRKELNVLGKNNNPGKRSYNKKMEALKDLNNLGSEGWEISFVVPIAFFFVVFLKREIK